MTRAPRILSAAMAVGLLVLLTSLVAAQDEDPGWTVSETPPETPEVSVRTIEITMTDFKLDPATLSVGAGPLSFALRNRGVIDHNLAIENAQRQIIGSSATVVANGSMTFDITLQPGSYTMVCTLPAHREAGMVGTLTVTP